MTLSRSLSVAFLLSVAGCAVLVVFPSAASAQAELQMWLNPEMGRQIARSDYRYTFYPERNVESQDTHFSLTEHRVSFFAPLYQDSANEWAVSGKALFQDVDTARDFPRSAAASRANSGM